VVVDTDGKGMIVPTGRAEEDEDSTNPPARGVYGSAYTDYTGTTGTECTTGIADTIGTADPDE